jgi:hypothetical protein
MGYITQALYVGQEARADAWHVTVLTAVYSEHTLRIGIVLSNNAAYRRSILNMFSLTDEHGTLYKPSAAPSSTLEPEDNLFSKLVFYVLPGHYTLQFRDLANWQIICIES